MTAEKEAAQGLIDLTYHLERDELPPPTLPKKFKTLGTLPSEPVIPPVLSTEIAKKKAFKKKGVAALQERIAELENFINNKVAPFVSNERKLVTICVKEVYPYMRNQSSRIDELEGLLSKTQAEVAGKNIIIDKTKLAMQTIAAKAKGDRAVIQAKDAELKNLRATNKGASKGTAVDEQIRLVEEKTKLQLHAAREKMSMKLDLKDEDYLRKMSREDDRANRKTGGAIKERMTNGDSTWALRSA